MYLKTSQGVPMISVQWTPLGKAVLVVWGVVREKWGTLERKPEYDNSEKLRER